MSVRAYRVEEIKYVTPNSFNLWHDEELVNFLDSECGFFESMVEDTGLTDVPVEVLEEAVKTLKLDEDTRQALQQDIEAGRKDGGYVRYYCF